MKLPYALISLILVVPAGLQSCGDSSSPSKVNAADSKAEPSGMNLEGQAKQAMGAAEVATKDAVTKGREEWKKLADEEMPEIDRQIAELKDKVAKSSGAAKAELEKLVQEIGEQRQVLEQKLGELKSAGAEKWKGASVEIDHSLGELKKSIDQALEKSK